MKATHLLDTNVLSELSKPHPCPAVLAWLDGMPEESLAASMGSIAEIQYGVAELRKRNPSKSSAYASWRDRILASDLEFIGLDARAAMILGEMFAVPALRFLWETRANARRLCTGQDPVIAATALSFGLVVVTMNTKDFIAIDRHFPLAGIQRPGEGPIRAASPDLNFPPSLETRH